ncbi:hypothetical protein FBU30_010471 [Linnemannia zychae]|nr:hypothetical protein FBU30_010471 [Linnemannia zychae]
MVLWSSGYSGRGRVLSSKRILLSGSLLVLVLFYYVALPEPHIYGLVDRTIVQIESAFPKHKKGNSALAEDAKVVMPFLVREEESVTSLPVDLNSFVENVQFDKKLPAVNGLRNRQETTVTTSEMVLMTDCGDPKSSDDASGTCQAPTSHNIHTKKAIQVESDIETERNSSLDRSLSEDEDTLLESSSVEINDVTEDDDGYIIEETPQSSSKDDYSSLDNEEEQIETSDVDDYEWTDEMEAESIQEEDDEQGSEREDGSEQELIELEEMEAAYEMGAEAKSRIKEAEEVLEEAIEELRGERGGSIQDDESEEEILGRIEEAEELRREREEAIREETEEAILNRIEDAEEEMGGALTDEMVKMIEDEVIAEEEASIDENMHSYVETLFRDEDKEDSEDEEFVIAIPENEAEIETEPEYSREDLLGQAGSGETMDDDE